MKNLLLLAYRRKKAAKANVYFSITLTGDFQMKQKMTKKQMERESQKLETLYEIVTYYLDDEIAMVDDCDDRQQSVNLLGFAIELLMEKMGIPERYGKVEKAHDAILEQFYEIYPDELFPTATFRS
tara:strand:- start:48 stop:425 length:378 start_codon:yes stop_codon:yes gene_type:complete